MPPRRRRAEIDLSCPACNQRTNTIKELTKHIRETGCVITPHHRPAMSLMGIGECQWCHMWCGKQGLHTHQTSCSMNQASPARDGGSEHSSPRLIPQHEPDSDDDDFTLLSPERLQWLDELSWKEVGICHCATIEPPRKAVPLYLKAHGQWTLCLIVERRTKRGNCTLLS